MDNTCSRAIFSLFLEGRKYDYLYLGMMFLRLISLVIILRLSNPFRDELVRDPQRHFSVEWLHHFWVAVDVS